MAARVQLYLCGPMDHLRIVWQAGESLLEQIPFVEDPDGTRYNVLLAVQEMVTNILRHAYRGDESQPVKVEFVVDDEGIAITLSDHGPAFDPLEVCSPESNGFPVAEGGYGIMIARAVMDEVDYSREDGRNVLRMHKMAMAPALVEN